MHAFLLISGQAAERTIPLDEGNMWTIGRTEENQVVIPSEWISRQHALLQRAGTGEFFFIDMGSRNGSMINGVRVTAPTTLKDGDEITFGDINIRFRCPSPAATAAVYPAVPAAAKTTTFFATRKITVLVVDVRGFTQLAQRIDQSLLSTMMGTFFREGGEVMQRSGSWGQKYIGDALMAVWVHRNEDMRKDVLGVLRALDKLVDLTDSLRLRFSLQFPFQIGAGLNTGAASLGNVGSVQASDHTALGETVNVAFRFETATKTVGADLVIGRDTFACLEPYSKPERFFHERSVQLKGYDHPADVLVTSFAELRAYLHNVGSE